MAVQRLLTTTTASSNHFIKVKMLDAPFSITIDTGAVVGGTPKYSLSVCNFDGDESDFRELDVDTTNIDLTDTVTASGFKFSYLGVKYTSNSATGDVQIYLNLIS